MGSEMCIRDRMIPVDPAMVKASVLSESVSSLPLVMDHVRPVWSPVVARSTTVPAQFVDMSQIETGMVLTGVPILDYQVNNRNYSRVGNS